jgi:hypothetical protein
MKNSFNGMRRSMRSCGGAGTFRAPLTAGQHSRASYWKDSPRSEPRCLSTIISAGIAPTDYRRSIHESLKDDRLLRCPSSGRTENERGSRVRPSGVSHMPSASRLVLSQRAMIPCTRTPPVFITEPIFHILCLLDCVKEIQSNARIRFCSRCPPRQCKQCGPQLESAIDGSIFVVLDGASLHVCPLELRM